MKVKIQNWHAVASWTWTTEDDVCGICHMPLDGCAPGASGPGDDSPVVWGRVRRRTQHSNFLRFFFSAAQCTHASPPFFFLAQCSHYFHLMCITTWLHNKNTCPICRRKWEFASAPKPAPATPGARRAGEGFMAAATAAQAANGIVQPPNQPPANPMPGAMPDVSEIIEAD